MEVNPAVKAKPHRSVSMDLEILEQSIATDEIGPPNVNDDTVMVPYIDAPDNQVQACIGPVYLSPEQMSALESIIEQREKILDIKRSFITKNRERFMSKIQRNKQSNVDFLNEMLILAQDCDFETDYELRKGLLEGFRDPLLLSFLPPPPGVCTLMNIIMAIENLLLRQEYDITGTNASM